MKIDRVLQLEMVWVQQLRIRSIFEYFYFSVKHHLTQYKNFKHELFFNYYEMRKVTNFTMGAHFNFDLLDSSSHVLGGSCFSVVVGDYEQQLFQLSALAAY